MSNLNRGGTVEGEVVSGGVERLVLMFKGSGRCEPSLVSLGLFSDTILLSLVDGADWYGMQ
jgi:hypothetical protein